MRKLFVTGWASLLFVLVGNAQIIVNNEVHEAIQHAIIKDLEVKNQSLELNKLELERKSVQSKYIPRVEAKAMYAHFNSDVALDLPSRNVALPSGSQLTLFDGEQTLNNYGSIFHGGVTAKAVLFSGGQIYHGYKALEEKNVGTSLMMENRKDEVVKSMIYAYDQLQLLKRAEMLIDESERRLRKESERVEKAIATGLAIPYDREKIKLARLELDAKRKDVQHKQKLLALKIAQETDTDPERVMQTRHQVDPIWISDELTAENRNELKALEHFKKASEYNIKKEKGSFLPSIGAFGGYGYSSLFNAGANIPLSLLQQTAHLNLNHLTLNPTWTIGVGLKWEVFSGFERKHKVEEARLGLLQVENQLSDAKEKLDLQLKSNMVAYENALEQIKIAEQRERIAENNNNLADKQYQAGLINITERLEAENALYEAALNKIEKIVLQRQSALETFRSSGSLLSFINVQ